MNPPSAQLLETRRVHYASRGKVHVGELYRYVVTYTPPVGTTPGTTGIDGINSAHISTGNSSSELWLKVKNLESLPLRAAYLAGPYILYVDVRPGDYDQDKLVYATADQPMYESQLKAGQSFYAQLYMHKFQDSYTWTVDIISQILFSPNASVQFEIALSRSKDQLHVLGPDPLPPSLPGLDVRRYDTRDLWNLPVARSYGQDNPKQSPKDDLHLVVLTHGLHSNVSADMFYLKERIDAAAKDSGENVVVRGFLDNVCRTEKGIKYLGRRVGDYVLDLCRSQLPDVKKISFLGHSLGGLVQTYAVAHIQTFDPSFFDRITPVNFICVATPFLGISNENPAYVKFVLDVGFAGKTGRDLGLSWKPTPKLKPLLHSLPTGATQHALAKFKRRSLYANAVNDGIVPLRTAAILYLDWKGLSRAKRARLGKRPSTTGVTNEQHDSQHEPGNKEGYQHEGEREDSDEQGESNNRGRDQSDGSRTSSEAGSDSDISEDEVGKIPSYKQRDIVMDQGEPDNETLTPSKTATCETPGPSGTGTSPSESLLKSLKPSGDFLTTMGQPFQAVMSFLAPQAAGKRPGKIYSRTQTLNDSESEDGEDDDQKHGIPKKTSMIESGVSVLIPPLPSQSFIIDPASRPTTIFHDKVYHESDLPPKRFTPKASVGSSFFTKLNPVSSNAPAEAQNHQELVERSKAEERMARAWHHNMSWRKVLVNLEPDAHNNIIVRRRFANAYGWPVVDHLVANHFSDDADQLTQAAEAHTKKKPKSSLAPLEHMSSLEILRSIPKLDTSAASARQSAFKRVQSNGDNKGRSANSLDSTISTTSSTQLWDERIRQQSDESEDDGIVHSVGSWIDNIRDIGTLNLAVSSDVTTQHDHDYMDSLGYETNMP